MRNLILAAGAALALTACGGTEEADTANEGMAIDANTIVANEILTTNEMMGTDINGVGDLNATGGMAGDNAVQQDLTTNDADTNLANGL